MMPKWRGGYSLWPVLHGGVGCRSASRRPFYRSFKYQRLRRQVDCSGAIRRPWLCVLGRRHRPHFAAVQTRSGCIVRRGEACAISRFGESDLSMKRHVANLVRRRTPQQFDSPHSRAEGWPATGGHAILGLHSVAHLDVGRQHASNCSRGKAYHARHQTDRTSTGSPVFAGREW